MTRWAQFGRQLSTASVLQRTVKAGSSRQPLKSFRRPNTETNDDNPFLAWSRPVRQPWQPTPRAPVRQTQESIRALLVAEIALVAGKEHAGIKTLSFLIGEDADRMYAMAQRWAAREMALFSRGKSGDRWDWAQILKEHSENGRLAIQRAAYISFVEYAAENSPDASKTSSRLNQLLELTDLRYPYEWAPQARRFSRKIIMHVGPTNSGKTYQALKALANARVGIYAGPLRLLAHEVYTRFNTGNIGGLDGNPRACNLLTGEERRTVDPYNSLVSCTVEMAPYTRRFDVAVIDEIQLITDPARGFAWTAAVLNLQASELHLCGEESAVDLVQRLAADTGDQVEVRRYERLSPLQVAPESLNNDLSLIQRGDCVVTFSRSNIFQLKQDIEAATDLKVAVAYGGLPPEVREEQARGFNEGTFDVLVASDAIGMGLNLKIRRVIFQTLSKWDGRAIVNLRIPQIKQIGGRAGRFGMNASSAPSAPDMDEPKFGLVHEEKQADSNGQVTTLEEDDMRLLRKAMKAPISNLDCAVILPPEAQITKLWHLLTPDAKYSQLLRLIHLLARTGPNYYLPVKHHCIDVAALLDGLPTLTTAERQILTVAPVSSRDEGVKATFVQWATALANFRKIDLQEWATESGTLEFIKSSETSKKELDTSELLQIESFHRSLSLYLWLSYRLQFNFQDAALARTLRERAEGVIEVNLSRPTQAPSTRLSAMFNSRI